MNNQSYLYKQFISICDELKTELTEEEMELITTEHSYISNLSNRQLLDAKIDSCLAKLNRVDTVDQDYKDLLALLILKLAKEREEEESIM